MLSLDMGIVYSAVKLHFTSTLLINYNKIKDENLKIVIFV